MVSFSAQRQDVGLVVNDLSGADVQRLKLSIKNKYFISGYVNTIRYHIEVLKCYFYTRSCESEQFYIRKNRLDFLKYKK